MRNRVYRFIIAILLGLAVFFGILAYREHKPFMDAKVSHEAIKKRLYHRSRKRIRTVPWIERLILLY